MTKIDALRRFLLPCIFPSTVATQTITVKKRLSTSLRDDLDETATINGQETTSQDQEEESVSPEDSNAASFSITTTIQQPRPSKSMVIGTIFGQRRGHVWFCVQHDRLSTRPILLLELSVPTNQLVKEMQSGLVRIALECARPELCSCSLRSVPVWVVFCNGRKIGFAIRRKASFQNRLMLKTMQSMTVGAGVIPAGLGSSGSDTEEIMYMRANYEHVVGSADSESFHLINPDESSGQEFSVFLLRRFLPLLTKMLEGRAVVRETDMPEELQSHVMELAYKALDLHEVSDCQSIAQYIKQKFDEAYGPAWHCVVGKDFGSCITYICGSFICFHVEMMEFLVFKDGGDFSEIKDEAIGVLQKSNKSDP
ncbi:hypothetical protein Dsin_006145 [Dipteronia sinensis]|uniref:Dynein light chain n=1 Tax=Dipteronia sinensis TaxID=43782 RepID=A0AAE0EFA2_9ROSI|nr:hypothetical protein Dsin_006145 [Dipteronia sinensis]